MKFKVNITFSLILCHIYLIFLFSLQPTAVADPINFENTPIDSIKHIHPRIYFTNDIIEATQAKISYNMSEIWTHIKEEIDNRISTPPQSLPGQNPMRIYGETLPYFAVGYMMTHDTLYLRYAKKWLLNVVRMDKWGNQEDLGGSHMVYGVSLAYDWLYHELTETERDEVVNRLKIQVNLLRNPSLWWKYKALQNHLWINTTAIGIAGFALYEIDDEAKEWIQEANDKLNWVLNYLSPDGSSPEGIGYLQYGLEYLMKYFDASHDLLGEEYGDVFFDSPYFHNCAAFIIHNFCPREAWGYGWKDGSVQLNWGDVKRYPWYGPDYLLQKCAAETGDHYAQWFAKEVMESSVDHAVSSWLSLIWYDPNIHHIPPYDLPTFYHFDDIDIAIMRSDWSGHESLLFFKSSPGMGHHFYTLPDSLINMSTSGNGHAHYDANSFMIFSHGEWLAIDPGYTYKKLTRNHNTIIVNGKGMINDGTTWGEFRTYGPDKPHLISYGEEHMAEIIHTESNAVYDYVIGDASTVYDEAAQLNKYIRHMVYFKPDVYMVIDELGADVKSDFEWLIHTEDKIDFIDSKRFVIEKNDAQLLIQSILPENVNHSIYDYAVPDAGDIASMKTLCLEPPQKDSCAIYMTLLRPGKKDQVSWIDVSELDGDARVYQIKTDQIDLWFRLNIDRRKISDPIFDIVTKIPDVQKTKPEGVHLNQNYPNPFNPETTISYELSKTENVVLSIYNLLGQRIETLVNSRQNAGIYHVHWGTHEVSSSLYLYSLETENFKETRKMVVMR